MTRLIGLRCTHSNVFSREVLIHRLLLGNLKIAFSISVHLFLLIKNLKVKIWVLFFLGIIVGVAQSGRALYY